MLREHIEALALGDGDDHDIEHEHYEGERARHRCCHLVYVSFADLQGLEDTEDYAENAQTHQTESEEQNQDPLPDESDGIPDPSAQTEDPENEGYNAHSAPPSADPPAEEYDAPPGQEETDTAEHQARKPSGVDPVLPPEEPEQDQLSTLDVPDEEEDRATPRPAETTLPSDDNEHSVTDCKLFSRIQALTLPSIDHALLTLDNDDVQSEELQDPAGDEFGMFSLQFHSCFNLTNRPSRRTDCSRELASYRRRSGP